MSRIIKTTQKPPMDFTIETSEAADKLSLSKRASYILICVEKPDPTLAGSRPLWVTASTNLPSQMAVEITQAALQTFKSKEGIDWTVAPNGQLTTRVIQKIYGPSDNKKVN